MTWRTFGRASQVHSDPLLSVVVPVYQVREYLDECLNSIREQALEGIEIVVVDDGSTDGSLAIAKRHAKRDQRIRIVTRPNGGLSAARNTGTDVATAPYLTFVDSDDIVTPLGLAALVAQLEKSGSDFAFGPYKRFRNPNAPMHYAPWVEAMYGDEARTVVAHEHPEILVHATAWSKVYRRDFWDRAGLRFVEGALFEDQEVSAAAFAAARRVDLVPELTYLWRRNRAGSITNEVSATMIEGFLISARASLVALEPVTSAKAARADHYLSFDVPRYLALLPAVNDPAGVDRIFDQILKIRSDVISTLPHAPVGARVVYELLATGRRSEVLEFIGAGGLDSASHRSSTVAGRAALETAFANDPDVDPAVRVLSPENTPLDARVTRVDLANASIRVLAYLRHLDEPLESLRAWWVVDGERVVELEVEPVEEFLGHRIRTTRAANERSSWKLRGLPAADTTAADTSGAITARLELEGTLGDRTALTRVHLVDMTASAGVTQESGAWCWDPASARLLALGSAASPSRQGQPKSALSKSAHAKQACEVDIPGRRVQVGESWLELPEQVGKHVIADSLSHELALRLPIDLADGWLGFGKNHSLVWTAQGNTPREQLTVWWQRDHAQN